MIGTDGRKFSIKMRHEWKPPVLDLRVFTGVLCCFLSGVITALNGDVHISAYGNGNVLLALALAVLKYMMLLSLCFLCAKKKIFFIVLFLYMSVCAVVFGFFSYAFFSTNAAVLAAFVLPQLIYCYVMTVLSSELLSVRRVQFGANGDIISKTERLIYSVMDRSRIILLGVVLEGVIAPFIH